MIMGLEEAVRIKTSLYKESTVKPVFINQDLVENIFYQVRETNGQNSHPDYSLYKSSLISVQVWETLLSKRGNTSGKTEEKKTVMIVKGIAIIKI